MNHWTEWVSALPSGMPSSAAAGNGTNLTIPSGGNVTLYYSPPPLKRGTPLEKLRFRLVDNATEYSDSDIIDVDVNVLCSPGYSKWFGQILVGPISVADLGETEDCKACPMGTSAPVPDSPQCTPCQPGTIAPG